MIYNDKGKELVELRCNNKKISTYYSFINGKLVLFWEAIKSCFGIGFWINIKPWLNKEPWKNIR